MINSLYELISCHVLSYQIYLANWNKEKLPKKAVPMLNCSIGFQAKTKLSYALDATSQLH